MDVQRTAEHMEHSELPDTMMDSVSNEVNDEPGSSHENAPEPELPFMPRVQTRGHQEICNILLPVLLQVMKDSQWSTRTPREQVREACYRIISLQSSNMFIVLLFFGR